VFAFKTGQIPVPIVVTEPRLVAADLQPVLEQAETIVGSPVQVAHGDQTWTLSPEQMSSLLDVRQEEVNGVATSVPFVSAEKLGTFFDTIEEAVATAPVDASFKQDGTKAWVVPGVDGERLDRAKTAEAVSAAALKRSGRVAEVAVTAAEPDLTTAEAERWASKTFWRSYSSEYWGTSNRRQNVRVATQYCSNVIMAPVTSSTSTSRSARAPPPGDS